MQKIGRKRILIAWMTPGYLDDFDWKRVVGIFYQGRQVVEIIPLDGGEVMLVSPSGLTTVVDYFHDWLQVFVV